MSDREMTGDERKARIPSSGGGLGPSSERTAPGTYIVHGQVLNVWWCEEHQASVEKDWDLDGGYPCWSYWSQLEGRSDSGAGLPKCRTIRLQLLSGPSEAG